MKQDSVNIFDQNWEKYDQWYERHPEIYHSELQTLEKSLPDRGLGLEIGVGTGRFATPFAVPIGLDPSLNMLQVARSRNIKVVQGRGENLPFQKETFHFISIVITICFVQDPLKLLKEVHEILQENGELILAMISKESRWGRFYAQKASRSQFYHAAHFYSVSQILEMLPKAHLEFKTAWQTLGHSPPHIHGLEPPKKGYTQGGFVVLKAVKK